MERLIKGAVFDLDGVLLDTEGLQWKGWIEVLKPFGIRLSKKEYFNYAGKTGEIIESELVKKYCLKAGKGSLLEKKRKLLAGWLRTGPIRLMPFARGCLEFFSSHGIKIAAASSSLSSEALLKLKRTGLFIFFDAVASRSDVKRGKPYPDIYLMAAKKLGLKPAECMAFEDTQFGLQAAKSAGLVCFAVPTELSVQQDFSGAGGRFKSLGQSLVFLKKNMAWKKEGLLVSGLKALKHK